MPPVSQTIHEPERRKRDRFDFYPTPPFCTRSLLEREHFDGVIWEPAAGDGSMAKVIESYSRCIASEIRRGPEVYGEQGVDFLKTTRSVDNIVTNPPFKFGQEFVEHALECADKKVAMLLRLAFLESKKRYALFTATPLKRVYVFSSRQTFVHGELNGVGQRVSGFLAFAWFVWDKSYHGEPMLGWIR